MTRPTPGEMELLTLLWEHGPISLSEAHQQMPEGVAYTTVQTRLNRLVNKGLATREKLGRQPTKYSAAVQPEDLAASQLGSMVDGLAGGSVLPLVSQLVERTEFTENELKKLKALVREAERRASGGQDK